MAYVVDQVTDANAMLQPTWCVKSTSSVGDQVNYGGYSGYTINLSSVA